MRRIGKTGMWAVGISLIAGAIAIFAMGPKSMKARWAAYRGKREGAHVQIDVP